MRQLGEAASAVRASAVADAQQRLSAPNLPALPAGEDVGGIRERLDLRNAHPHDPFDDHLREARQTVGRRLRHLAQVQVARLEPEFVYLLLVECVDRRHDPPARVRKRRESETSSRNANAKSQRVSRALVEPEDVPGLLSKVANLISQRAARKVQRELRHAN